MNTVAYYIKTLTEAKEKITHISVGPLTNPGMSFSIRPEIIKSIEEIVIVGAAYAYGNITAAVEFDWWCDP